MKRFESYSKRLTWSAAFLLTAFVAGCGGGGDGGGTKPAATKDTVPPTVVMTSPADVATGVCVNKAIVITFSEAMKSSTITGATFTVTDSTPAAVTGAVTVDATGKIATFTPAATLAPSSTFTATITGGAGGAADLAGNVLASNKVLTFTTGTCTAPSAVALGAAATFGAGSGAGVTNEGTSTKVVGDLGTSAAATLITGFHDAATGPFTETPLNIGLVTGTIFTATTPATEVPLGATAAAVGPALNSARNTLIALPGGTDPGAGELGGQTLLPGVYTAAGGTFQITGSDLILDAQNDANAVWVFQMASSLTVGDTAARSVKLVNGAQSKNVFWAVGSAATINAVGGGTMEGTIIAPAGVTFSTAGNAAITTLNGRAFGFGGAVTMVNTVINVPAP